MASGYETNIKRQNLLFRFAKELVRRSRSKCELCDCSGEKLHILEVPHDGEFTDADHCVFICEACREQVCNPKKLDADHWRCLNNSIWSEVPAVQVMATRMLRRVAKEEYWAKELLDQTYLDADLELWAAHAE